MIQCDPKKVELGFIASKKAVRVLEFLESCAGAPESAVALLFPRHYRKSLRILRGSGYARRCWSPGQDALWCPVRFPVPKSREEYVARCALGWLAARLTEAGGKMDRGRAVFPGGKAYRVAVWPGKLPEGPELLVVSVNGEGPVLKRGWLYADYADLQGSDLKKVLSKNLPRG